MKLSVIVSSLWLGSLLVGCSDLPPAEEAAEVSQELRGLVVPNPGGQYTARVNATGTGCPAGTWDPSISADGKKLTVKFTAFEPMVLEGESFSIKDCALSLDLRAPTPMSFSVSAVHAHGVLELEKSGMKASHVVQQGLFGAALPAGGIRRDFVGPIETTDYAIHEEIPEADRLWSPCDRQRSIVVSTRLTLQNDSRKSGTGYMNTWVVDADFTWPQLGLDLAWRPCTARP